jgi:hypothetical protein
MVAFGIAGLFLVAPGSAACSVVGLYGLNSLADGSLIERGASAESKAQLVELRRAAKYRLEKTFGPPEAEPIVVWLSDAKAIWPFTFNEYASSSFVPGRVCVVMGPNGRTVDVVAHELLHAEVFTRLGHWRRQLEIPTWFDEGLAMQVDFRERYVLPEVGGKPPETKWVRELRYGRQFFRESGEPLVRNYAAAKVEVRGIVRAVGEGNIYTELTRVAQGESFAEVFHVE